MTYLKLTIYILLINPLLCFSQIWQQLSDLPGPERDDAASFTIGTKVYCGTGLTWTGGLRDMYVFDTNSDTWEVSDSLPAGNERQYACGFSYNGTGFIFGGVDNSNTFLNDLWIYDTLTKLWQQKTSLPSAGRSGASCFEINGIAYIISGKNTNSEALKEVWAYDIINDTWVQKNNLPTGGRWRASVISLDNKGYLIFGKDENLAFHNELYKYDPGNDSWAQLGNFPGAGRNYAGMVTIDGNLYVTMGIDTFNNAYNDLWRYKINTAGWEKLTSLPASDRKGGLTFTSDNTAIYYATGNNKATLLKETWKAVDVTSLPENNKPELSIYPNPAYNAITIDLNTLLKPINLKMYNALGELVFMKTLVNLHETIAINEFPSGIYFLSFVGDKEFNMTKKINIQH